MKKILFFLTLLTCFSCTDRNKSVTNADKEKIIGEAKILINTVIQTCEQSNPEKLMSTYLDSPDFISLVGGKYADYKQSLENVKLFFADVKNQKSTIFSERYIVLDKTTVLYTASSKWEVHLKNNSTIVMDPLGMQFLLKNVDGQWKILSWTETK